MAYKAGNPSNPATSNMELKEPNPDLCQTSTLFQQKPILKPKLRVSAQDAASALPPQATEDVVDMIDSLKGVLHAFKTALETLENLVKNRIPDEHKDLGLPAQNLRESLVQSKKGINDAYRICYKAHRELYVKLFTVDHENRLQQICSALFEKLIQVLHVHSAPHVVLHKGLFYALCRESEIRYRETTLLLHQVISTFDSLAQDPELRSGLVQVHMCTASGCVRILDRVDAMKTLTSDEKGDQNAAASATFRQRRKEKELEAALLFPIDEFNARVEKCRQNLEQSSGSLFGEPVAAGASARFRHQWNALTAARIQVAREMKQERLQNNETDQAPTLEVLPSHHPMRKWCGTNRCYGRAGQERAAEERRQQEETFKRRREQELQKREEHILPGLEGSQGVLLSREYLGPKDSSVSSNEGDMSSTTATTAKLEEGSEFHKEASPVISDRWAQIRTRAAERATQANTEYEQDGDEETIESRVARIKARVAELIGNTETSPPSQPTRQNLEATTDQKLTPPSHPALETVTATTESTGRNLFTPNECDVGQYDKKPKSIPEEISGELINLDPEIPAQQDNPRVEGREAARIAEALRYEYCHPSLVNEHYESSLTANSTADVNSKEIRQDIIRGVGDGLEHARLNMRLIEIHKKKAKLQRLREDRLRRQSGKGNDALVSYPDHMKPTEKALSPAGSRSPIIYPQESEKADLLDVTDAAKTTESTPDDDVIGGMLESLANKRQSSAPKVECKTLDDSERKLSMDGEVELALPFIFARMMKLGPSESETPAIEQPIDKPPVEEDPLHVNAKQFHRILKRRVVRQMLEHLPKETPLRRRGGYAQRRPRGPDGKFLTSDELATLIAGKIQKSVKTTREETDDLSSNPSLIQCASHNISDLAGTSFNNAGSKAPEEPIVRGPALVLYDARVIDDNYLPIKKGEHVFVICTFGEGWLVAEKETLYGRKFGLVREGNVLLWNPDAESSDESLSGTRPKPKETSKAATVDHKKPLSSIGALSSQRKGLWWQGYLALSQNHVRLFASLNETLSNEFGFLTSTYNTDTEICKRTSTLVSRAFSAQPNDWSYDSIPLMPIIKLRLPIIHMIRLKEFETGLKAATLGWACVSTFLAIYDPLLTSDPLPSISKRDVTILTISFRQLNEIATIISQFASRAKHLATATAALKSEYETSLQDLCVKILEWFSHAFIIAKSLGEDPESPSTSRGPEVETLENEWRCAELIEEIQATDQKCQEFKDACVVAEKHDLEKDSEKVEAEIGDLSDGSWEVVDDEELLDEGVTVGKD